MFLKSRKVKEKLVLILIGIIISIIALIGCGEKLEKNSVDNNSNTLKIGINQLAEHPALDLVRDGFKDGLNEHGLNVNLDIKNAQGDISNSISISEKFVSDDVDLIFAIATPTAQSSKQVTEDIPILFSAVTDPVESGLVKSFDKPETNITGTSDKSPVKKQLQLFKDLDPNIKKIGIVFNTDEPNSKIQIDQAVKSGKELDLEIETIGVSNINDIPQAVDSILSKVDGIYTITDNMVASAINVIADKANEKGIITIGGEEAHVKGGILMTDGISYYELGKQSARMAKEILIDNKDINDFSCETAETTTKVFNQETLEILELDIDNKAFNDAKKLD